MTVMSGEHAEARVGNCLPLSSIPVGANVHNIEMIPGKGRTDGTFSRKLRSAYG